MHDIQPAHTDMSAESQASSATDVLPPDEVDTAKPVASSEDHLHLLHTEAAENSDDLIATVDKLPSQPAEGLQHSQGSGPSRSDESLQVASREDDHIKVDMEPAAREERQPLQETPFQPRTDRSEGDLRHPSSQKQLSDQTQVIVDDATDEHEANDTIRNEDSSNVIPPSEPEHLRDGPTGLEPSLDKPSETDDVHDKLLAEIEARKEKLHLGAEAEPTDPQRPEQPVQQEDQGAA